MTLEDKEFEKIERCKNRLNISWEQFIIMLVKEFTKLKIKS